MSTSHSSGCYDRPLGRPSVASRLRMGFLDNMVEPVGIEPTLFLMSLIYSQLPSPLGTRLQIEFESSSAHVIGTIHPN